MWQPDGWGWRARIGVLTPHADIGPEAELRAMAPDGVSIHAARIPLGVYAAGGKMDQTIGDDPVRTFADPPHGDDAAELLAAAPLHAIVYGFTSSSYVRGAADDALLKNRLETRTRGIPVIIPCAAAALALASLGVTKLALINPPWFSVELSQKGAGYFQGKGFEVVHHGPAGLPSDQTSAPSIPASSMSGSAPIHLRTLKLSLLAATAFAPLALSRLWKKTLRGRC